MAERPRPRFRAIAVTPSYGKWLRTYSRSASVSDPLGFAGLGLLRVVLLTVERKKWRYVRGSADPPRGGEGMPPLPETVTGHHSRERTTVSRRARSSPGMWLLLSWLHRLCVGCRLP